MSTSSPFSSLITQRLHLRRLDQADAEGVFSYRTLPEVSRFQAWQPASVHEVRTFIEGLSALEPIAPGKWFQLGITLRETGDLIGDCGIHAGSDEPRQVEIGITLSSRSQGKGLASEALEALLDFLFTQTETHRVFCSVDPNNLPCLTLLERMGLRKEAHMKESLWLKGAWVDDVVFATLRDEWKREKRPD